MSQLEDRIDQVLREQFPSAPLPQRDYARSALIGALGLMQEDGSTVNGVPFSIRFVSRWMDGPAAVNLT